MFIKLDDDTILSWYLSQIKLLDPLCSTDTIKTNYSICSSKKNIMESFNIMKYDISNKEFDLNLFLKHLNKGIKKYRLEIIVDFILNQRIFSRYRKYFYNKKVYMNAKFYHIKKFIKSIEKNFIVLLIV